MERGLRGRSAHGQSGGREGPVLLLLLGSHLPSSPLLLPQEGLSPPHPTEHPGLDSGAWGARGCQPGSPGWEEVFGVPPGPGILQQPLWHRWHLPQCPVNQPQEGLVRAAPKNLMGTRAGRAGGVPDSEPRLGCTSCAPGGIHRAPTVLWLLPNPLGIQGIYSPAAAVRPRAGHCSHPQSPGRSRDRAEPPGPAHGLFLCLVPPGGAP